MKKRVLSLLLALCLCVGLLPLHVLAETSASVTYLDADGNTQTCTEYTLLDSSTTELTNGWYVVKGTVTLDDILEMTSDYSTSNIHLILCDDASLTVPALSGLENLHIYAQSTGDRAGKLTITKGSQDGYQAHGLFVKNLTVNGGVLDVRVGDYLVDPDATNAANHFYAIYCYKSLTVNGGTITAVSADRNLTVGNCENYGIFAWESVALRNCTVNATGGDAIASGDEGFFAESGGLATYGDSFSVTNSTLTATGGDTNIACGIGNSASGVITSMSFGIEAASGDVTFSADSRINVNAGNAAATRVNTNSGLNDSAQSHGIYTNELMHISDSTITTTVGTTSLTYPDGYAENRKGKALAYGVFADSGAEISGSTIKGTLYADNRLFVTSGSFDSLYLDTDDVVLTGGEYKVIEQRVYEDWKLANAPAVGYAFYRDNTLVSAEGVSRLENVSVKAGHTCSFTHESGSYTCAACGKSYEKEPVPYLDRYGLTRYCGSYSVIDSTTTTLDANAHWFVVKGNVTINKPISHYYASIILSDGAELHANAGMGVSVLYVYAQSTGANVGKLFVEGDVDGNMLYALWCRTLIVCGGEITATSDDFDSTHNYESVSAGINCEKLTVYNGTVKGIGGDLPEYIDNAYSCKTYGIWVYEDSSTSLNIYGGKVTGIGGSIAGGTYCDSIGIYLEADGVAEAYIDAQEVTATGGSLSGNGESNHSFGLRIRSTDDNEDVKLQIHGGKVTATGGDCSDTYSLSTYGIFMDGESYEVPIELLIDGGTVEATGGDVTGESYGRSSGLYIYALEDNAATFSLLGGKVTATGGDTSEVTGEYDDEPNGARSFGMRIYCYEDAALTVANAELTANGGNTINDNSYGLYVSSIYDDTLVDISDSTVNVTGGNVTDDRSYGMYVSSDEDTTVRITNSTVHATAGNTTNDNSYGMYIDSYYETAVDIKDSTVTAIAGTVTDDDSCGMYVESNYDTSMTIDNSDLTATGNTVTCSKRSRDSYGLYIESTDDDYGDTVLTLLSGSLTATGGSVNGTNTYCDSYGLLLDSNGDDSTLNVKGGTLTATSGNVDVQSSSDDNASRVSGSSYGLYMDAEYEHTLNLTGGKLICKSGNVIQKSIGSEYSIFGESFGLECEDLNVSGGRLEATAGNIDLTLLSAGTSISNSAESFGVCVTGTLEQTGGEILATSGKATLTGSSNGVARACGIDVLYQMHVSGGYLRASALKESGGMALGFYDEALPDLSGYSSYFWRTSKKDAFTASQTAPYVYDAEQTFVEISPDGVLRDDYGDDDTDEGGNDGDNGGDNGGSSTPAPAPSKPSGSEAPSFDDVSESDWFYSDVRFASENGLMTGTGTKAFSPNALVTRGMVMTILARREGVRTDGSTPWYAAGREWAMSTGISDGTDPEAPVTREQLAAMLYRYAQYKGYELGGTSLSGFADASSVSSYALTSVQWAVGSGILNGVSGKLLPQSNATRAQLAAMLHRMFG